MRLNGQFYRIFEEICDLINYLHVNFYVNLARLNTKQKLLKFSPDLACTKLSFKREKFFLISNCSPAKNEVQNQIVVSQIYLKFSEEYEKICLEACKFE